MPLNATGMVYPREGEILNFRLYDSGCIEFDDYPLQNPFTVTSDNVVITRVRSSVSANEVKDLKNLLQQRDLLYAKSEYPPIGLEFDAKFVTTVVYRLQSQEKSIVITDYGEAAHSKVISRYPPSLSALLDRIKQLTAESKKSKWSDHFRLIVNEWGFCP